MTAREQLDALVRHILEPLEYDRPAWLNEIVIEGFHSNITVVSKERPRLGRSGHVYTPKKTADFEAAVKGWAEAKMFGKAPVLFPVSVRVTVYDKLPTKMSRGDNAFMAELNLTQSTRGDLDNKVKAIMDAVNGVVFADDRQVSQFIATRRYSPNEGYALTVRRHGLTDLEADNVTRLLKFARSKA